MENEPPTWLNEDFLTLALQGGESSSQRLKITKFNLKLGVTPGSNYTSQVFRVDINYRYEGSLDDRSISLIIKAPLEKSIGECYDKIGMFYKEPMMYKTVLSVLSEKAKYEFSPQYYYSGEGNILVLKDLTPDGYIVCDKFKQLDIKHCRKVMERLGKFHASSVAYQHENPDFTKTVHECFYKEETPMAEQLKVLLRSALESFAESLSKKDHKSMENYVTQRLNEVWNNVVELCAPSRNGLNVLNHGDCWTNNVLFKYNDSGYIIDVKFIDYQLVRYSSPVTDLLFFLWTSGDEEVRDNHQLELYNIYLQTLNQTLDELNCEERLTHEELETRLKSSSDWVLLILCYILPVIIFNNDNKLDFETISLGDEINNKCSLTHSNITYQELLPGYLRQFERIISSGSKASE